MTLQVPGEHASGSAASRFGYDVPELRDRFVLDAFRAQGIAYLLSRSERASWRSR